MRISAAFLSITLFISISTFGPSDVQAQNSSDIDPSFSASWYNAEESGHGIMIHLIDANTAWLCWFAFDLDGNPAWICAIGTITGNTIEFPEAITIEGGAFPPNFDPDLIVEVPWGSITIVFTGCDSGMMSWTTNASGFQSGSMPLTRLTQTWGAQCQFVQAPAADIVIPRSEVIPTIGGAVEAGEWDDAVTVDIVINSQWTVPVSLKNDGSNLYVLFSNVSGPNDENRVPAATPTTTFPEIFIDRTPKDPDPIDTNFYWFHVSFQDCFLTGNFAQVANCNFVLPMWMASNWPLGNSGDHTEMAISYERLNLEPNQSHRIGLFATMTSSLVGNDVYHNWPTGSEPDQPNTWSVAELE